MGLGQIVPDDDRELSIVPHLASTRPLFLSTRFTSKTLQPIGNGGRNILGMVRGSDPHLQHEVVIVGAHYDHVGYGTRRNSFGPIGYIHNGADDNASGTAALLEVMQAFAQLPEPPRRSVVFAAWDGEAQGLLGSRYCTSDPTLPLARDRSIGTGAYVVTRSTECDRAT